jgi:hypothetical protein
MSSLERAFSLLLLAQGWTPAFVREYRFNPDRHWRFDFADIPMKIAVELEGGVFTRGAHTRGKHFESDLEKYNSAALLGWRVLRYTRDTMHDFVNDYKGALIGR